MTDTPDKLVPVKFDAQSVAQRFSEEHGREWLTILFTDLVDSTQMQSDLGNEEAARITELHRAIVRPNPRSAFLCRRFPDGRNG